MNALTKIKWLLRKDIARVSIALATLPMSRPATAHPVVFANGTAIMGHHQGEMSEIELVHSPTPRTGLGFSAERHDDSTSLLGKASALVWRGNYPDYQTNLYFGLGVGKRWNKPAQNDELNGSDVHQKNSKNAPLYQWNIGLDGEDRQYYSMLKFAQTFESKNAFTSAGTIRLGFAPYKAQNDELTIWGIVEWSPEKTSKNSPWEHDVTPLVRLFYKNALIELGSSMKGKFLFNYMFHFFQ